MSRFSKYILWMLLILGIIVLAADQIYDYIFLNTSPRDKVQLAIKQKQGHVDYLFLGNSRVENYIDCSIIEKTTGKTCENFGMSGTSYQDSYVLLNLLKENGLTYSHLFIQLDATVKNETMTRSFKASLVPFIDSNIQVKDVKLKLSWSEKNIPFYKYAKYDYLYGMRACFAQLYKNKSDDVNLGFIPQYEIGDNYASQIVLSGLKNKYVKYLKENAIQDQASIHFYTSPYCAKMKNTIAFNKFKEDYKDYINYASFYKNEDYFANCTHMNFQGAQIFTRQLIKDFNL